MNIQLTNRIKQNARSFSKGQRLIAKYIEEHYDKVAFMTASKLGATVGVIGYSGYPALQQAMQEMIRNRMTSVQRLEMTSTNIPLDRLLDSSMDQDIDIIRRTKESISHEEFYRAADALVKVKKVYIIGAGSSLAIATFLSYYFRTAYQRDERSADFTTDGAHRRGRRAYRHQLPAVLQKSSEGAEIRFRPRCDGCGHYGQHAFSADEVCGACAACKERHGFICRFACGPAGAYQRAHCDGGY